MMKFASLLLVGMGALALAACGKTSLTHRDSPDEFAISRNAPLVVPPDFSLAPPKPGAARPIGTDSQSQAIEALFGPGAKAPPKTPGELSLLDKAGASKTDSTVRSNVGSPGTATVDKGAFLQELLGVKAGTTNATNASITIGG
jgi:hypothetical protein